MLFRIALLHRHLRWSGIGGLSRSRWDHLGSRSVSVGSVRGTRGRGKRLGRRPDGRRAARRPCEPPPKTSGEICCLEQCPTGRREPRAFLQRRGTNVVVVGRGPMANMGCPRLSAVLGRPHDGSGKRRHDGAHQPARTWGEVRWWCVRAGRRRWSPWGLAGAFSGLDIAFAPQRLRGRKACHGSDGASGRPIYPLPAAQRGTERRRNGFSR